MVEDKIMLTGKVAIVTGAGRGIGLAICEKLASRGAIIAATDIIEENAKLTAKTVEEIGTKSIGIKTDVANRKQVEEMVKKVLDTFGQVDILVNNAGWDSSMPFIQTTEDLWDKIIAINYKGVLNCCKAVLDHMVKRPGSKIISIVSDSGRVGSTGEGVYSGCKGAVIAFSKTLAREIAQHKINVNVISPGPTESLEYGPPTGSLWDDATPEQRQYYDILWPQLGKAVPWGRTAQPMEIAEAVAFFASAEADYITGQTLSVSGGLTMI